MHSLYSMLYSFAHSYPLALFFKRKITLCVVAGSPELDLRSSCRGRHGAQGVRGFALVFSSCLYEDLKLKQVRSHVHFISVIVSVCLFLSVYV